MIRKTCILIFSLAFIQLCNAQNPYFLKDIQIGINSPVLLNYNNYEGLNLETNGLKIHFKVLGGMEGIGGLDSSLVKYASSLGFQNVSKAGSLNLKNLQAARLDADSSDQKVILVMLATKDFKQHFICKVYYLANNKPLAEAIVKSLYLKVNSTNVTDSLANEKFLKPCIDSGYSNSNHITPSVTNSHKKGTTVENITWQILSKHSPNGYIILDDYLKASSEFDGKTKSKNSDFTIWIEGSEEKDVVNSANTVVHEMCHRYTKKLYLKLLKEKGLSPIDSNYSAYYIGNHQAKLVKHSEVFATNEINSIFPEKLKTSRYTAYISPSKKTMYSQRDGCYGLLDELNAYYWGTRTSYDLYNYFKINNNTEQGWSNFFSDFYGNSYSYLELKSYILYYLIYAKDNHKEVYDAIIANKDFLEAFQKIDENWWKLIIDFKKLRQTIINTQIRKGVDIREEGGTIYIGNNGTHNFSEIYNFFKKELLDKKLQSIAHEAGLRSSSGPDLFNF